MYTLTHIHYCMYRITHAHPSIHVDPANKSYDIGSDKVKIIIKEVYKSDSYRFFQILEVQVR